MKDTAQPDKESVSDPLYVVAPGLFRSPFRRDGRSIAITRGEETLASIEEPGLWSGRPEQLRFRGRRYRLARPDDATVGEAVANMARSVFGVPRRRRVWRAGAGIVTEIRETTETAREAAGRFVIDDQPYHVQCTAYGSARRDIQRLLFGPRGLTAELEPSEFSRQAFFLTPRLPTRLDVLAIGLHMMFWLNTGFSGGGGAGGAGGGGGGGDGGGGC